VIHEIPEVLGEGEHTALILK